jgi:ribosomal protein S18 acetylase RimI-like enzyme
MLKDVLAYCAGKVQGLAVYRRVARALLFGVQVREAGEEDLRRLSEQTGLGEPSPPPPCSFPATDFVAGRRGKILGHVQVVRRSEESGPHAGHWLSSLYVCTAYRGMGIGERLALKVIEAARAEGAGELLLLVFEDNDPAIRLYRKLGFDLRTVPALEPELERERLETGRRRVLMAKGLHEGG